MDIQTWVPTIACFTLRPIGRFPRPYLVKGYMHIKLPQFLSDDCTCNQLKIIGTMPLATIFKSNKLMH